MTFDTFVAAGIAAEAERDASGAWVDQVHQPEPDRLVLTLNVRGGKQRWLFCVEARTARVHQESHRRENPAQPSGFCMLLRKHLNGSRLVAVEQPAFDRVLHWRFRRGDEQHRLVVEIMGKHSNVMLLDESNTILDAIKRVPTTMSRVRPVLPGLPYLPPPSGDRRDPRTLDRNAFAELFASSDGPAQLSASLLVKHLAGMGPFAAAEVLARANDNGVDAVWDALRALLARASAGGYAPVLLREADGRSRGFWCFETRTWPEAQQEPAGSLSAATEAYYHSIEEAGEVDQRRAELRGRVRAALERSQRQLRRIEEDEREGARAEEWRVAGELLAGNQWQVKRGDTAVEVLDYYDPEQGKRLIELDPLLTPQENVERLFRRHRKAVDAATSARTRSGEVTATVARLEALRSTIEATPAEQLAALAEEVNQSGVPALGRGTASESGETAGGGQHAAPEWPSGVRIRRFSVGNCEILYGENATSNDYLTTRVARPHDWWLHVRAAASAHVVVRSPHRDQPPPPDVLQAAARAAASHSESKHASIVPVDYVQRRHVRKPRRSAPGRVTYQNEKTLFVDMTEGAS